MLRLEGGSVRIPGSGGSAPIVLQAYAMSGAGWLPGLVRGGALPGETCVGGDVKRPLSRTCVRKYRWYGHLTRVPRSRSVELSLLTSGSCSRQRGRVPYRSSRPATQRQRAEIGDRIRSLRRSRQLSQEALGHLVGVGRESIMAIEGGRTGITLDAVLDIAYVLGVDVTWLFSDDWTQSEGSTAAPGVPLGHRGNTADD